MRSFKNTSRNTSDFIFTVLFRPECSEMRNDISRAQRLNIVPENDYQLKWHIFIYIRDGSLFIGGGHSWCFPLFKLLIFLAVFRCISCDF